MNEQVEYINNENLFKYKNIEIKCPNDLIKVDSNNYKIFLFKNNHLQNSQSNIWAIKLDKIKCTCGFLLPITRLDDSEETLSEENTPVTTVQARNKYKYACYELLLKFYNFNNNKNNDMISLISELYPDVYVLILCNKFIGEFNIYNYLPYLYKLGFLYVNNINISPQISDFHKKNRVLIEEYEGKQAIKLEKTFSDISKYEYIKNLFIKDLISVDNNLARFMMLYQIVEIYIENRLEHETQFLLNSYKQKLCNFNDFKENINKIQKERHRVDTLLKIKTTNNNFETEYKKLNLLSDSHDTTIGNQLYNIRNKLVHSFHLIENRSVLNNLITEIELVLIDLLLQKPINLQECIREKAYFISLENPTNSETYNWLLAEQTCKELK